MGLRVRVVLVVLSLLAIAALAVPLALSLADRRTAALAAERDRQLAALADAAAMPDAPLQRLVDRYYEVYGEGLLIIDSDGRTLASRGLSTPNPASRRRRPMPSSTHRRRRGPASCPGTDAELLAAAGVRRDGELVGAVVLAVDTTAAARDVADRLAVGGGRLSGSARRWPRWSLAPSPGGCCARSTGWSAQSPR